MKKLKSFSVVIVLAFGIRTVRADDSADIKKYLAFLDKIVDTVVADQDNCPKMGTDLNALIDANKDILDTAHKARAAGKKLPPDDMKHVQENMRKIGPGMQKCHTDKGVSGALARLKG